MMHKIIILTLLIPLCLPCSDLCQDCIGDTIYTCTSCPSDSQQIYLFSCPYKEDNQVPFIVLAAIITALHVFMITMGQGVYRSIFENIQLVSLITWRYGFQKGAEAFQCTNLGVVRNNSFPDTFGSQFIVVMILLGTYWVLLIAVDKIPHSPTAILIKRKKIILPTRIITFVFNMLLYSSLIQVTTIETEPHFKTFAFTLAILALFKILVVTIGLAITSNWKRFEVDDPHYYVLVQQLTSKKWYAKNSVLFSLINRSIIIISFVVGFKQPEIVGVIMVIFQFSYTFYVVALLRYTKIRYYIFIVTAQILTIAIILVIYIGSTSEVGSSAWNNESIAYFSMVLAMVILFFMATMSEIVIKKDIIMKQLKSMYSRFIKCENLDQKVLNSKYDENNHREKVTQFNANLLYKPQNAENQIEMSNRSNS